MTYIPPTLPNPVAKNIAAWMERNGCRDHISLDYPIIIRGRIIEYVAICRKDAKSVARVPVVGYEFGGLKRKRLRLRYPFAESNTAKALTSVSC